MNSVAKILALRVPSRTRTESAAHPMEERIAMISGNTLRPDAWNRVRHHITLRRGYLQMRRPLGLRRVLQVRLLDELRIIHEVEAGRRFKSSMFKACPERCEGSSVPFVTDPSKLRMRKPRTLNL